MVTENLVVGHTERLFSFIVRQDHQHTVNLVEVESCKVAFWFRRPWTHDVSHGRPDTQPLQMKRAQEHEHARKEWEQSHHAQDLS